MGKTIEKYLPIGSVVLIKGQTHQMMIIGYKVFSEDNPKEKYDYAACFYPEGIITMDQVIMFNHMDIKSLYFIGYPCKESLDFCRGLLENGKGE